MHVNPESTAILEGDDYHIPSVELKRIGRFVQLSGDGFCVTVSTPFECKDEQLEFTRLF